MQGKVSFDKTVKMLLAAIAVLLAVIAFRPYLDTATTAQAQIGGTNSSSTPSTTSAAPITGSYQTTLLNRITFADSIQGLEVMDRISVFLVRTQNRVEVYRIDAAPTTK